MFESVSNCHLILKTKNVIYPNKGSSMYKKLNLSIVFLMLIIILTPSLALEFRIHENNSKTLNAIMATGKIRLDDTNKLEQFLSMQPRKRHTAIYFNSPGGDLSEGIKLGKYFHQNRIKTVIQGESMCASACALAFLGGTDRKGNKWMSTTTTSLLGFHAFSQSDGKLHMNTDVTQRVVAQILEYSKFVNAPRDLIIKNFMTPSKNMYWLSDPEALRLGIKVWDIENKRFMKENNFNSKPGMGIYPRENYACMTVHTYDPRTRKKVKLSQREQQRYTLHVIDKNKIKIGYYIYSFVASDGGKDIYRHFYKQPELRGAFIDFKIGLGVENNGAVLMPMYFDYYDENGNLGLIDDGICTTMNTLFPKK